ncbi:hydroxyneurosporene-O-methyltransferase [Roseovarius mucosus DSM 17069]|uniref:Hydroxyneurosporene-O-methyltransferase n=1 Tax=Roseovarius mucosus DSM 17069 TaxID=1288298 RepID=A0A0A0HGL2_9RHOB|nr:methyltransferase [Roseovarius mucosus]KGM86892.1 hydroxyneurosporene-O-methyltransferase [Roseovarius mucosus DSM 17069]
MAVAGDLPERPLRSRGGWLTRLIANPRFQHWASGFPLTRGIARRDGAEIFDIVQGFVQSQVLSALVELDLLNRLAEGPQSPADLARRAGMAEDRMAILLQAGAALGLLRRRRDGSFALARKGAAILGVPGLEAMIRHHRAFYADMADPVALLRGEGETELARFWPYVFGAAAEVEPEVARRYSDLMAQSQGLVAQDVLRMVSFKEARHLLDIGGGSGAFLAAVAARSPDLRLSLFDLPEVIPSARARLTQAGLTARLTLVPGSFRSDPLPEGADTISLIRVLYDHDDATVTALLAKVHAALPAGGRLIVAEPMAGGARPERAGDVYFAFYTMAMGTGRARSAARIAAMCRRAGFTDIRIPHSPRPFVTSALSCVKTA